MGLGVTDRLGEDDGGGGKAEAISCSICLEMVADTGDRSWSKLQCGHQFHLDCIGSAFNAKGSMQCPNCRQIEKGQWLYGNGNRPLPEFNMDDWAHEEDLYDTISYSEMSFGVGVHWCPFSGLTRLPSPFDEGEFSASAYHDLLGHHAIIEHTTVSSTSPYIAYVGPVRPSSTSTANVPDGSSFNSHWTGTSVANEAPSPYGFPSADVYYHNWDHSSLLAANSHIGGSDQPSIPPVTQRTTRNNSDVPRPGTHPYILNHSSMSRAPSSVTSTVVPPYPGIVSRPRDHVPSLQAYFQQSTNSEATARTLLPNERRSSSHRRVTQVAPAASSSDQSGGFYLFSPPSSSGRTFQDGEFPMPDPQFYGWETEHQSTFPGVQSDRDHFWSPFHPAAAGSDIGIRSTSFRQRHGPGRMPPQ